VRTRQTTGPALVALVFAALVVLIGGALLAPAGAPIETYKGAPPAPSQEHAPTPGSPGDRPAIEPAPGKPSLVPAPGQIDGTGRVAGPRTTILGLSPMTAFLVGLGVVGVLVLSFAALRRRPGGAEPEHTDRLM
jgi:hypothetical protein